MRRVAGRNSRGCRTIVISIQNINPINLIGNVVIMQLLIDIVCTNVEVTNVNNDIRVVKISIIQTHPRAIGLEIEIKFGDSMTLNVLKYMCKVLYSQHFLTVTEELLLDVGKYITILPSLMYYSSSSI